MVTQLGFGIVCSPEDRDEYGNDRQVCQYGHPLLGQRRVGSEIHKRCLSILCSALCAAFADRPLVADLYVIQIRKHLARCDVARVRSVLHAERPPISLNRGRSVPAFLRYGARGDSPVSNVSCTERTEFRKSCRSKKISVLGCALRANRQGNSAGGHFRNPLVLDIEASLRSR